MKNSNEPLFFLFTCVKDGRKYIEKLFNSLLAQTKVNFVHYIYEDGSIDPIEDLVEIYKQKSLKLGKNIDIFYEKNPVNIGLNMATKHCIEQCNKPYFIWMNCDDWLDSHFFENLEYAVNKNKEATVFQSKMMVHYGAQTYFIPRGHYEKYLMRQSKKKDIFIGGNFHYNHFAVKTDDFFKINPSCFFINNKKYFNDVQTILPFIFTDSKFVYVNKSVSHYLKRLDSEFYENNNFTDLHDELFCELNIHNYENSFELKDSISGYRTRLSSYMMGNDYKKLKKEIFKYKQFLISCGLDTKKFYFAGINFKFINLYLFKLKIQRLFKK